MLGNKVYPFLTNEIFCDIDNKEILNSRIGLKAIIKIMKFIIYNSKKNLNQRVFQTLKKEKFCIIKDFHSLNDHKKF